jgi:cell division protein FtsZ
MNIKLAPPKLMDLKPRITVIGIGGAGCNAINNMIETHLEGVEFIVANTDAQSLSMSHAERRIQLGANVTEGLGAGARPEVGEAAAREAEEDIRAEIAGSHMVFIAAGMGGGTGTGAASVVAEIARDLGILTVGIVSKPFQFEGARRMRTADAGIEMLEKAVDTLIVIPNQNLFRIANERTTFAEAFRLADQVLYSGIACIVDLIVKEGLINLDFADVKAVMKGMGSAMMGTGEATGENRALEAANEAIANPLLDNVTLSGAQGLLISIVGGKDLTLYEVDTAASHIRKEVAADANIIVGATTEEGMNDRLRVSIVASGMNGTADFQPKPAGQPALTASQATAGWSAPETVSRSAETKIKATPSRAETIADAGVAPADIKDDAPRHRSDAGSLASAVEQATSLRPAQSAKPPALAPRLGDADVDASEADEFARALSEAMRSSAEASGSGGDQSQWRTDDGVVVEEGFIGQTREKQPPPLPTRTSRSDASSQAGFEPTQPASVRRSSPRMPDVSDFSEIAQREYFAKMEQASQRPHEAADNRHDPINPESADDDSDWYREPARTQQSGQAGRRSSESHDESPAPSFRQELLRRFTGGGRK